MVAAETQLIDRTEHEQRRYDRARTSRPRAAQQRAAGEFVTGELDLDLAPDEETARLVADFGHTTDAANVLLAEYDDFTDSMARFVNALIGIAGDRLVWFDAGDWLIAQRAARSVKWVQLTRKDFIAWQKKRKVSVADVEDHQYDPQGGNKSHRYKVHLSRLAAEATLDARASREWAANPGKALEGYAKNLRNMLPIPEHKKHKPDRPKDAARQINSKLKHIGTLMDRVEEIREATGGHVEINLATIEDLKRRLEILEEAARNPLSTTLKKKVVEMRNHRRSAAPVHPGLPGNARAQDLRAKVDEFTDEQHAAYETAVDETREQGIVKGMTTQDAHAEALRALGSIEAFIAGKGGGGNNFHPPQATTTDSTVKGDFTLEPDEIQGETLQQIYKRECGLIYDREIAAGKSKDEAAAVVLKEKGEFPKWAKRRRE